MVVVIKDKVNSCDTAAQGAVVFSVLLDALNKGAQVTVDFRDVLNVTSSFVNVAFIPLLATHDFSTIRRLMVIVNANRQIANMIKQRMAIESEKYPQAA